MKNRLLDKILDLRQNNELSSNLYLLEVLDLNSGFFYWNNKILFAVKNSSLDEKNSIDTIDLSLRIKIYIDSVDNNPSFKPDYYDVLIYNGNIENDLFETYLNVCKAYIDSDYSIDFVTFFYSIVELFQMPKNQSFNNLIGFFGELLFIQILEKKHHLSLVDFWHYKNLQNKYDFMINDLYVEINDKKIPDIEKYRIAGNRNFSYLLPNI